MTITRATDLANIGSGIGTIPSQPIQMGIGVTIAGAAGVVTATTFIGNFTGDGAGLTGVASTDNIVTGTAATFTSGVTISGASNISVTGVVTATSFVGSGANLTGVSGFATALSSDASNALNKVFKTPVSLGIAANATIQSDATSDNHAFMREARIHVQNGNVLTVGSGTTVIMNVLDIFP